MALSVTDRGASNGAGFSRSVGPFTPANGSLLVAIFSGCHYSANALANAAVSGGGLTWTKRVQIDADDWGNERSFVTIWTAPVATGASTTVTSSNSGATSDGSQLQVYEVTGQGDPGATATGTRTGNNSAAFSMNLSAAPAADSYVFAGAAVQNWYSSNPITNGSGWTEDEEEATGGSTWCQAQRRTGSTSQAVSWAGVNHSERGSAAFAALEIKVAATAGAATATLGNVTATAAGALANAGAASVNLDAVTGAATGGAPSLAGSASATLDDVVAAAAAGALASAATARLQWSLSTDDGGGDDDVRDYQIARGTSPNPTTIITADDEVPAGTTQYDDTVSAGTYYWRIRARDQGGNVSSWSDDVTETIGAIDGTAAVTLGAVTSSATGAVALAGAAASTLASVTGISAGAVALTGSALPTLAEVTAASAAALAIVGAASGTLAAVTGSGAGALPIAGSTEAALEPVASAATGALAAEATGAAPLGDVSGAAEGKLALSGALSASLADVEGAAEGTLAQGPSGSLAVTLDDVAGAASAALALAASGAGVLDGVTAEAAGTLAIAATASASLAAVTASASGALVDGPSGSADVTLAPITGAASATLAITGSGEPVLADVAGVASGTLVAGPSGAAHVTLAPVTGAAAATLALAGSGAPVLADVAGAADGTLAIFGAASATLESVTSDAFGVPGEVQERTAAASITLANVTGSAALWRHRRPTARVNSPAALATGNRAALATGNRPASLSTARRNPPGGW